MDHRKQPKDSLSYSNLFNLESLMNFQVPRPDDDFDYYGNSSQDESRGSQDGAVGNGMMSDRELSSVKKRRRSQNSDYEDDDSYYGTRITEERYRSMLGEHIQKYKRRFKDSSSSPAPIQTGIPVPKSNKGLKSRKLGNEHRGGIYEMETSSEWLNDSNPQKPGNHHDADLVPQRGTDRIIYEPPYLDIGDGITYRIPPIYDKLVSSLHLPSFSDFRVEEVYLRGTLDLGSLAEMMTSDKRLGPKNQAGMGDPHPQYESLQARLKASSTSNSAQKFSLKVSDIGLNSSIPEGAAGNIKRSILSEGGVLQVYYVKVLEKGDTYEIIERSLPKKQKVIKDPSVIEKEEMDKIGKVWVNIVRRDMPRHHRIFSNFHQRQLGYAKRVSENCQREVKLKVSRSLKLMRGAAIRTRKLARDMLLFWKRIDKEMAEVRKKEEKEAAEALRREQELREAKRQQQRLNFLIQQTELYSHFMQNKSSSQPSEDLPVGDGKKMEEKASLSSSDDEANEEEDPEEAELKKEAFKAAQDAVSKQKKITSEFDNEYLKLCEDAEPEAAHDVAGASSIDLHNPSTMPVTSTVQTPELFKGSLKEYQLKGLQWLVNCYEQGLNGILADEMGLGKTIQAMAFLAHLAEEKNIWGPFLVVAPASVLNNWADEISRFCPDLKTLPYWGGLNERQVLRKKITAKKLYRRDAGFHILITSYQLLVADEKYFKRVKWQYMVLDEAQAIKSSNSIRWKTLLGFNCRNRLLLTGTPIQNNMAELWALLHFIMPTLFDSHEQFNEWFSKGIENHAEHGGTLNEHQLNRLHSILKPFMLRRVKTDVVSELTRKTEVTVHCKLSSRQQDFYQAIKNKISLAELFDSNRGHLKVVYSQMSKAPSSKPREPVSSSTSQSRDLNEPAMDDEEGTMARVAQFIEQLHASMSSLQEKELITARLLGIAKARKDARTIIGSHSQAMPLFISILRNGTPVAKVKVAATLSVLCKDEDLRLKVLLGGCIPPLLSLLKSESIEARKAAAEAIYEVSSGGLSDDHVGIKIFITEGVVPNLWNQLNPKSKQDKVVEGFVTGALRNLCGDKDGYWKATLEAGGVDIIVGLLSSDNAAAQSNAASLLARLMLAFSDSIPKVIDSGAVKALLQLVGQENDVSVRASAADALEALSSKSTGAKKAIVNADGLSVLIGAIVAPSKECMQGECGQALQGHATRALANICGGMSALILYLGELSQSPRLAAPVADIIGALAYTLMVFEHNSGADQESVNVTKIEDILVMLLKPQDNKLVQERVLEAMASLYGNNSLSSWLNHAQAKKVLIGLITMAAVDVQEYLIPSLTSLCCDGTGIWESIGKREGIQLLISLLGLSSEQHQEYAVQLLAILADQVDDSKWAITAAGGIPPLVQLLETGSQKAKEDAAHVLWNLCCHSEDIRACVESAGAIPAFLWLLKSGGSRGQEASAKALTKLVPRADSATINQLLALLLGDSPSSKAHTIRVLGHVLIMASHNDLVHKGSAANKGLRSLVQVLNSSNEETQEYAASVLADLFSTRQDICDTLATDEIVHPCMKLLTSNTQGVATQSARALGALSRPMKTKTTSKMSYIAEGDVKPLIRLAKTSSIDAAETAVAALANLLSDPQIAAEALAEDVISALIRVLGDGTSEGKKNASRALRQFLKHFPVGYVLTGNAQCCFAMLAIVDSLNALDMVGTDAADALEVVALLARTKQGVNFTYRPWSALAEVPSSLESLVRCLAEGPPPLQDKAIEILSRLCDEQPVVLGDLLIERSRSLGSLANRVMNSSSLEIRVGGAALLICAAKEYKQKAMEVLDVSGYLKLLVYALVDMMKQNSSCSSLEIEVRTPRGFIERTAFHKGDEFDVPDPAIVLGGTVALWLLCIIGSFHAKSKLTIMEAGGLEVLSDKLACYTSNPQAEYEDTEGIWISALLLAILFEDANVVLSPVTMCIIPSLALLLRSDEMIDRFFAAQSMASLVSNGSKGIILALANSGAVAGLITLIGYIESDVPNLVTLSEEFSLVRNPDQVVLEYLFYFEDVRVGSTARKSIPLLVDLLRPMPERPGAPPFAVKLLTRIANGSDTNKLIMGEAGALDALTKYLSLSPQDSTEATITELFRILFSNPDIIRYEASASSLNQLIAVLRLGSRTARYSAARALHELFDAENIRDSDLARQSIQPLVDMLNAASESEQEAALVALIKLTSGNSSKAAFFTDGQGNPLESLYKILSSASSLELRRIAAQLCCTLFDNTEVRASAIASECVEPLISLMHSDTTTAVEAGVCAFEKLLDDEHRVELAMAYNVVDLLVGLVSGTSMLLIEASVCSLIKLGKDRTPCKLDMVNAGIIDKCLELLPAAPSSLCSSVAELFRILTNSNAIARSLGAAQIVEPLFIVLQRPDFNLWGQHSALQALVNILEKPQSLATLKLTPSQVIEPLISFLESPSQAIQQLGTELLSHLLAQEHFQQDITTKNAVVPLVQLAGIGILNLQQTAVKALEKISTSWPRAVADAGGIFELGKVIIQDDPQPPHALWESAALVLSNVLRFNAEYYFKVPVVVLVKMLHSTLDSTITVALNALLVHERNDNLSAEQMTDGGAIEALLDLLRSHQCEEASGRLLEALFNNVRIRQMKVSQYAIAPLSQYLLDPQTKSQSGKLLAALALGDLSQHEGLARARDSVSACRALISLLEEQPTEEMKMVSICALQNFVMNSRTNRRAVAEAGGILIIQELLLSPNAETAGQAALLIKFLFSNHTLQEYVSNELIRSLTAALERELWTSATINEEVLRALHMIFVNFPKLHISEAATLCIPNLIGALKSGSDTAQDVVLDTLSLLRHSWSTMPIDIAKSQAVIAAEAIPILQMLMKTCPPSFQERADSLLHCLPGCLTVTIKRGNNLKQAMGGTNAFCRLTIGNGPPRQTKVVSHSTSPEWKESFTWAFDVPPKGQKLHIICKSKNTFGKTTLGRVTIQIDKVVSEGVYSGLFSLNHDSNKDGSSRTLEIEIIWSNRMADEET